MDSSARLDGVSALSVLLIAAFAVDRIVTAILFLLEFIPAWAESFPDPILVPEGEPRVRAERRSKFIYFVFAAAFSGLVVYALSGLRTVDQAGHSGSGILYALGFQYHWIDIAVTMLILMGGAERISELLKSVDLPKAGTEKAPPIEITGKLTLDEGSSIGRRAGAGS
jgi:hypothetical protein